MSATSIVAKPPDRGITAMNSTSTKVCPAFLSPSVAGFADSNSANSSRPTASTVVVVVSVSFVCRSQRLGRFQNIATMSTTGNPRDPTNTPAMSRDRIHGSTAKYAAPPG